MLIFINHWGQLTSLANAWNVDGAMDKERERQDNFFKSQAPSLQSKKNNKQFLGSESQWMRLPAFKVTLNAFWVYLWAKGKFRASWGIRKIMSEVGT